MGFGVALVAVESTAGQISESSAVILILLFSVVVRVVHEAREPAGVEGLEDKEGSAYYGYVDLGCGPYEYVDAGLCGCEWLVGTLM